ncbi:MAG: hypothetical protein ACM3PW_09250 [Chlamydiota bacterium]
MIAEEKPTVTGRATDVRGTTPAVAPTPSEEPEIDTSPVQVMLMTPEPARQGFYHGRHIRIEHSSPAPNPTVALLQQRPGPAQPGRPAQSNMKEGASPIARTGKPAAATAPSQDIPRIAASQKNSAAATPAGNREMAGSPVAFSPRQPAGPPVSEHESAFALAPVRRTAPREEKQPEGPRLSIGLLEVQIIQEPSQVPQTKTPSSGLPGEHDDLERSYVRPIG